MVASPIDEHITQGHAASHLTMRDGDCLGMGIVLHEFDGELDEEFDEPLFSDTEESSQKYDSASDSDTSDSEDDLTPPNSPPSSPSAAKMSSLAYLPTFCSTDASELDQREWLSRISSEGEVFLNQSQCESRSPLSLAATSHSPLNSHIPPLYLLTNITVTPAVEPTPELKDSRFVSIANLRRAPLPPPSWNRRRFSDPEDSLRRQILEREAFRVGQPTAEGVWWFSEDEGAEMASVF